MDILRYVLPSLLAGSIAGVIAAAGIVLSNIGALRDLIFNTPDGWIAMGLMTLGFVVTFGSVAIGAAIIRLGSDDCS